MGSRVHEAKFALDQTSRHDGAGDCIHDGEEELR